MKNERFFLLLFPDNSMEYGKTITVLEKYEISDPQRRRADFSHRQDFPATEERGHTSASHLSAKSQTAVQNFFEEADHLI